MNVKTPIMIVIRILMMMATMTAFVKAIKKQDATDWMAIKVVTIINNLNCCLVTPRRAKTTIKMLTPRCDAKRYLAFSFEKFASPT